jgi:hypothetical protein
LAKKSIGKKLGFHPTDTDPTSKYNLDPYFLDEQLHILLQK